MNGQPPQRMRAPDDMIRTLWKVRDIAAISGKQSLAAHALPMNAPFRAWPDQAA